MISNIRTLIIFCINVDIHEMLLLLQNKGQGITTLIVIPLCNSVNFLSVSLRFYLHILINNIRNLIIMHKCRY